MDKVSLVAFDLDGTVFASPFVQEISPRVAHAFEHAASSGVVLAACSGRPLRMLGGHLAKAPWLSWAICASGAYVAPFGWAATDEPGLRRPIPHEVALELVDAVAEVDGTLMAHTDRASYSERILLERFRSAVHGLAAQHEDEARGSFGLGFLSSIEETPSIARLLRDDPAILVEKLDASTATDEAGDELAGLLARIEGLSVARVNPTMFEITSADATKGKALDWLCGHLGIDPAESVAFGDSANDLPLKGHAGTFVAMGNAATDVKAAADDICEDVADDGVARWLEAHL